MRGMLPFLLSTRRGRCPHRPITLSESGEGASGERADVGSAARRPPFGAQLPHSGGTWRKDRPLRETSPMAPGQARFVDLARPRHPAGERQWVLGCRSMQVSGAGDEGQRPSTEPGVGKGRGSTGVSPKPSRVTRARLLYHSSRARVFYYYTLFQHKISSVCKIESKPS